MTERECSKYALEVSIGKLTGRNERMSIYRKMCFSYDHKKYSNWLLEKR